MICCSASFAQGGESKRGRPLIRRGLGLIFYLSVVARPRALTVQLALGEWFRYSATGRHDSRSVQRSGRAPSEPPSQSACTPPPLTGEQRGRALTSPSEHLDHVNPRVYSYAPSV